ncbi:MAG: hypothetical protein EAX95_11320, partial [Candidatus Thorarchaeota archaeon]|nr:hypothetical protein [Candidatus Thorarchaeota archaeon]
MSVFLEYNIAPPSYDPKRGWYFSELDDWCDTWRRIELPEDVREIILNSEKIVSIDFDVLRKCNKLEKLELYGNYLEDVNLLPLKYCVNLKELTIAGNLLGSLETINLSP